MEIFGIRLMGITGENARKLLLTLVFVTFVILLRKTLHLITHKRLMRGWDEHRRFWVHQGFNVAAAIVLLLGVVAIWFDNPTHAATVLSILTAGLAFALQKVVTAVSGYFVILKSRVFTIGDRILMAGVRGDVIALGFTRTTIMEMGQPPGERPDDPTVWVQSRQFTGRIVTVTNDKVFEAPVFNYTQEFPFIWEEMSVPVSYDVDSDEAERILLEAARHHTDDVTAIGKEALSHLRERFSAPDAVLTPRVYYRITSNWVELTVRFIVKAHGVREVKDAMSREILTRFREKGMKVASATFDVVGLPAVAIRPVDADRDGVGKDALPAET